jgi:hypothetical protein
MLSHYVLVTKVVELIFMNTIELVLLFLDFSTISYEFAKLAEKEKWKRVLILYKQAPGKF